MSKKYCLYIIILLSAAITTGCVAASRSAGGETACLPLNEGVKDLSFLSSSEIEILETVNRIRSACTASGKLQPLKISRGLSFASSERANELAGPKKPAITKEEERNRLFGRVRKFGAWKGSVSEIASYGYSGSDVVTEIMKNGSAAGKQPPPYFMDVKFAVMGVGCTSAGFPSPICVITFASEFQE